MSEYQYYEFQVIDRALTPKEMAFLRRYSTRATITATSFVNEYEWGSFKGDEDAWMDRFFDAFLYTANWGTNVLKLRAPTKLLSRAKASAYCAGDAITARQNRRNTIVTLTSNDENGGGQVNEHSLGSMISIRNDLIRGDLRALYLGWLAAVQNDSVDENTLEPEVPAGLGDSTRRSKRWSTSFESKLACSAQPRARAERSRHHRSSASLAHGSGRCRQRRRTRSWCACSPMIRARRSSFAIGFAPNSGERHRCQAGLAAPKSP